MARKTAEDPELDASDRTTSLGVASKTPGAASAAPVARRHFVRSIANEAVGSAGRLAGWSGVLRDSLAAAGRAVADGLEATAGSAPGSPPVASDRPSAPAGPVPGGGAAQNGPADGRKPYRPSAADDALLHAAQRLVLATNQPGSEPQLSVAPMSYDGAVIRIPSRLLSSRVANAERDARVSLVVEDREAGAILLISGRARIVPGSEGVAAARAVLEAVGAPPAPDWEAPTVLGGPVTIEITLDRVIRRSRDAAG